MNQESQITENLSIIVAMSRNHVIGRNNQLPWHLPEDLRHFKELTLGKPIIMGRKTFDSIGKPLPQRKNIVITHNPFWKAEGCFVATSLTAAIALANDAPEIMIIGGATIFEQALPFCSTIYLTLIQEDIVGDTYFPKWNDDEWDIISQQDFFKNEQRKYDFSFITLKRKVF